MESPEGFEPPSQGFAGPRLKPLDNGDNLNWSGNRELNSTSQGPSPGATPIVTCYTEACICHLQ